MGSRSVTYHPAEVTFPPSRSSDPGGRKADDLGHIPRWHTHPETVTHPGTNRARRGLTSFMQRMPLTTTPRRQQAAASLLFCLHTLQRSSAYTAAVLENNTMHTSVSTRSSAIAEGPRDASCQLKSCQLPRNSADTTYATSPDQIDGMKLEI